jgi:hypothetical protein
MHLGQTATLRLYYRLPDIRLSADIGVGVGLGLDEEAEGLHLSGHLRWEYPVGPIGVQLGVGARRLAHDYAPASMDELGADTHLGVHALVGAVWKSDSIPFELVGELTPGVDLSQSDSCTFLSGVDTLCPHQGSAGSYLGASIGARYWLEL